MCGRYAQGKAIPELVSRYVHLGARLIAECQELAPGFNYAPGMPLPVLAREEDGIRLEPMRWGYVPHWAKDLAELKSKPINARSETADTSGMFRDSFRHGRCLVPATGFFEWKGAKAPKQPYFIHPVDEEICSFAGLCSRWRAPGGQGELVTVAILTTSANEVVHPIHDRMPCILHREEEAEWLDGATTAARCKELLRPYPAAQTRAYPVSTAVNKPGVNGPALVAPMEDAGAESGLLF